MSTGERFKVNIIKTVSVCIKRRHVRSSFGEVIKTYSQMKYSFTSAADCVLVRSGGCSRVGEVLDNNSLCHSFNKNKTFVVTAGRTRPLWWSSDISSSADQSFEWRVSTVLLWFPDFHWHHHQVWRCSDWSLILISLIGGLYKSRSKEPIR